MLAIWRNPSSHWRRGPRAIELVLGSMRQKQAAPQGRGAGTGERGNAGGGGGSQKKTRAPACGACRTGRRRFRSTVRARRVHSARWHACPTSHRAATYCHHARLGVDRYAGLRVRVAGAFAASKGGDGYRRVKAMLRTRVSEKVLRGIMAEDGLTAHVPERRRTPLFDHIQVWNTWTPSTGSRGRRTRPAPGPHPGPARRNGRRRPCPPDRPAGTRTPSRFASIFLKQFLYYFSAV